MTQQPHRRPAAAGAGLNLHGAVDLGALSAASARRAQPAAPAGEAGAASGFTVDVTEAEFQAVVERSTTVPVVVQLASGTSEHTPALDQVMQTLVTESDGAFLLARVDVDTQPRIAEAFGVQAPAVVAVVKGQPVPLFQGVAAIEQVRPVIVELLKMAVANGVTGRLTPAGDAPTEPVEDELPPLHAEAFEAIERDDLDAAADAYGRALAQNPADAMATAGLAQVDLLRRVRGVQLEAARAAAAAAPTDVDAQLVVADLDVAGGHVEDAFVRLVDLVRVSAGDDRDRVRQRLLDLFAVVGPEDPRVAAGRRALTSALF